jgi:hypothetical protein
LLETWEAERFEEEKQSGRTRPMVIECSRVVPATSDDKLDKSRQNYDTINRLMLVKTPNAELQPHNMFSEVYGNLIAREFDVNTPSPALINISPEFIEAMNLLPSRPSRRLVPGFGVGCEYLRGLAPVLPSALRNNEEIADVQAIFGVDMLLQNPDRRLIKPNCASYQGGILAFDFEMAFSFLLPLIGTQPPAWAVHEQGIAPSHLFYSELKRRNAELDWTSFMQTLVKLTDQWLMSLFAPVPVEWRTYANKVTLHVRAVRDNAPKFEASLVRSLL